jgi:hypothetical protein
MPSALKKKICRYAFSVGFMNGPLLLSSSGPATRTAFLNDASADKPSGLFIGFDIMRELNDCDRKS